MRVKSLLLALGLSLVVGKSFAISFKVDGINYLANADTAIIKGYSEIPENGELKLASTVTYGGKDYRVTTVQSSAFMSCTEIKKLTVPASIKYIQTSAFENCVNMSNLVLEQSDEQLEATSDAFKNSGIENAMIGRQLRNSIFEDNTNLIKVVLDGKIKEVKSFAFSGCKHLKDINLENVEIIGKNAFSSCFNLQSVTLASLKILEDCAFSSTGLKNVEIPTTLSLLGYAVFKGSALEKAVIKAKLTMIPNQSFSGCSKLTNIDFPNTVTEIGSNAFANCAFTSFDFKNICKIGTEAFSGCEKMEDAEWGKVSVIEINAFKGCGFKSLTFPASLQSIYINVFSSCPKLESVDLSNLSLETVVGFENCKALKSVIFPSNVMGIGYRCFANCTSLANIDLPETIQTISDEAFRNCASMEVISLPASLQSIGRKTFADMGKLKAVDLSSTKIISIPSSCFEGCPSLVDVKMPQTIQDLSDKAFYGCSAMEAIVFPNSLQSLGGETFANSKNLKQINLENTKIHVISKSCFANCTALTKVLLNLQTDTLEEGAFENCSSLKEIDNSDNIKMVYTNALANTRIFDSIEEGPAIIGSVMYAYKGEIAGKEYVMPSSITCLADRVFANQKFQSIKLNSKLQYIGHNVFENCDSLVSLTIPESVKVMEASSGCKNMTALMLKDSKEELSLTKIPDNNIKKFVMGRNVDATIDWMPHLKYLTIGKEVNKIGENFANSQNLTDLELEDASETLDLGHNSLVGRITSLYLGRNVKVDTYQGQDEFYNYDKIVTKGYGFSNLEDLIVGDYVTAICDYFCYNNMKLSSVDFPRRLKTIGKYAFYRNPLLEHVGFNEGLISIGDFAFGFVDDGFVLGDYKNYLSSIGEGPMAVYETLEIPSSVQSIGQYALSGKSAKKISINEGVGTLGYMSFMGCSADTITIPSTLKMDNCVFNYATYKYFDARRYDGKFNSAFAYTMMGEFLFPTSFSDIKGSDFGWFGINKICIPENVTTISGDLLTSYYGWGNEVRTETTEVTIKGNGTTGKLSLFKAFDDSQLRDNHKVQLSKLSIMRDFMYDFGEGQSKGIIDIGMDSLIIGDIKEFTIKSTVGKRFIPTTAICLSHHLTSCDKWRPEYEKILVLPGSQLPKDDITYMYTVNKLNYESDADGNVLFDGVNNMPYEITPVFYQDDKEVELKEVGTYDLSMKISGTSFDGIYPTGLKLTVGDTSGINNITMDSDNRNCPIYNMSGQRVDKNYNLNYS